MYIQLQLDVHEVVVMAHGSSRFRAFDQAIYLSHSRAGFSKPRVSIRVDSDNRRRYDKLGTV